MSRMFAIAVALVILLTSCAPAASQQQIDVHAIEEKVKANLRVELEGLYQGQLDALKAENAALKAELEALKSQTAPVPDLSGLEARIAALEAAGRPESRPSFLAIRARAIAEALPSWDVVSEECGMGLGIIDAGGKCITDFVGFERENGSSGWFLVFAQAIVLADYGITLGDEYLFFAAQVDFPKEIWEGAETAEDQELAQSLLEWPSFKEEAKPGTQTYALRWWPLSETEANILIEQGLVRKLER